MKDAYLPFVTALGFGLIALVAGQIGADNTIITLLGTLAGYVLGRTGAAGNGPPGV